MRPLTKSSELVKRRGEGTPVAYLVGKKEFYSLPMRVTPDVLIPRPETEFVVVAALDALKESSSRSNVQGPKLVADVGTGSGAIAVAIAKHAPQCRVIAIDVSDAALAIAKENAEAHGVEERVDFREGDLLSALPAEPRFTVIASNPPYVSEIEFEALAPEVRKNEPRQALVAGPSGTEVIERLIPQAAERLLAGGWLIVEVSPMIAGRVGDLVAADGRFEAANVTKDLAGLARVVKARQRVD
jgi:release factor glutamine methyltransferase